MRNDSVSPPVHYKVNLTITECCEGFLTIGKRCIPECQRACVNSYCIGKNKCKCNSGYYPYDEFRCLPICDVPCGDNMACMAPNKCFCKPEYKPANESHCEPICSFGDDKFECLNANCIAPNKCECFEGFMQVSEFQCEPMCKNCDNGDCISPEVCECKDGFEKNSDDVCAPVCNPPCINGNCIEPNVCKCNDNFEKYLKSHECLEKQLIKDRQSCEKSCQHGTCSDDGTCVCESDYEMYNDKCLKKCDNECTNGKCLEDQCICPENYKLSENSTECLPICAFEDGHACISGDCIAPQTCQCFEGYRFLDSRNCTCVPMCSPPCINGICLEDGCKCHKDFYNISAYECIKNCSEGFKWVHDECMEDISFDSGENNDLDDQDDLMTVDDETTTKMSKTTSEENSNESNDDTDDEDDDEDKDDENEIEGSTDGDSDEEGSSDVIHDTTERFV
jgi:hypothetical protein